MPYSTGYHLISGLPRLGSALLAAFLRRNPAVNTYITSPVDAMLNAMLSDMRAGDGSALFFTQTRRKATLSGFFGNHDDPLGPGRTVFDTNLASSRGRPYVPCTMLR